MPFRRTRPGLVPVRCRPEATRSAHDVWGVRQGKSGGRHLPGLREAASRRLRSLWPPLADGGRFCDACGAPVGETRSPKRPPRSARSSRSCSPTCPARLRCKNDSMPRRPVHVMDRVHRLLADAVANHAGRVVKFTGDGLMAVFGIPVLREDDALRAVRAGAAMQGRRDAATEWSATSAPISGSGSASTPVKWSSRPTPTIRRSRECRGPARGRRRGRRGADRGRTRPPRARCDLRRGRPRTCTEGQGLPVAAMRIAASELQTSVSWGRPSWVARVISNVSSPHSTMPPPSVRRGS